MSQKWTSPVYVFFETTPEIEYKGSCRCHVFECAAGRCKGHNSHYITHFLDKGDANFASNLLRHAKTCWGTEAVDTAMATRDLDAAQKVMEKTKLWNRDITAYRHTQHMTSEARYVLLKQPHSKYTASPI